ncbi:MAG TPA: hypothetical protein VLC46_06320 [Thermoanaerobaculia bacterium]|jgi:hypothetical protein|nr:hypothetical protein [Thermoanaerobaculia bacterium]
MRRIALPLLLLAAAQPLAAAYAERDLVIPVVGRASGGTGRLFFTALWITNAEDIPAVMTLSYLESGHANPSPKKTTVTLAPRETRIFDPLGPPVLSSVNGIGALRIQSNADVVASARIYGYVPSEGPSSALSMALTGIPTHLGVGNGQSALLHGYSSLHAQYKVYIVETAGAALSIAVSIEDLHGQTLGEKRIFLNRFEHVATEVRQLFPAVDVENGVIRLRGVNGNGRIIAEGTRIVPGSQDACAYEMSFGREPRTRIRGPEAALYIVIALVIALAIVWRRK